MTTNDQVTVRERVAKAIYESFKGAENHPWQDGGNSFRQDDARRYADVAIEALTERAATQPAEDDLLKGARNEIEHLKEELFYYTRTENPAVTSPEFHFKREGLFEQAAPVAATQPAGEVRQHVHTWKHAANEWADTAYNGLQWLRNIEQGITTDVKKARENMESCCAHSREVADNVRNLGAAPISEDTGEGALAIDPYVVQEADHAARTPASVGSEAKGEAAVECTHWSFATRSRFGFICQQCLDATRTAAAPVRSRKAADTRQEMMAAQAKEWIDKTNWVQEQQSTFPLCLARDHRADVMRVEIERLRGLVSAGNSSAAPSDELDRLLTVFGNLQFDIGEWDEDEHESTISLQDLVDQSKAARTAIHVFIAAKEST